MEYELAKELKDNGFEPDHNSENYDNSNFYGVELGTDFVYDPSLSELIEACGEKFVSLNKVIDPKGWSCDIENTDGAIDDETFGKTPEEAVARLWLALNKK